MRITTFRGEKSLREITSKLFQDLTPEHQERAEQDLLRANPQLASLADVAVGTVLLVPDGITARPNVHRGTEQQPAADIAKLVAGALADYRRHLTQAAARGAEEADVTRKALKDKELVGLSWETRPSKTWLPASTKPPLRAGMRPKPSGLSPPRIWRWLSRTLQH